MRKEDTVNKKKTMEENELSPGKVMQPLRLSITGEGSGPDLMSIIAILGGKVVSERIFSSISQLNQLKEKL